MKEKKDYTVGTYIKKKARKEKTGTICPICASCKDKKFCKNRRNTKLMLKCPECKDCSDKNNCDTFYIFEEHKATIIIGKDEKTGKTIRKSFCAKTEREAIARSVDYQQSVERGDIPLVTSTPIHTIVSIIQEYENRKLKLGITKGSAYHTNMYTLNRIKREKWSEKPINEVTREQIENFLDSEQANGMSNSILKKDHSLLRCAFDIALEKGYISQNQHFFLGKYGITRPFSLKPDKKVKALTLDEQIKLINYLKSTKPKHGDLFLLCLNTGARVGEMLSLQRKDIHLTENYFEINRTTTLDKDGKVILGDTTKTTSSKRVVVLNEITKPILKRAIENRPVNDDDLIFCKSDGSLYSNTSINSAFKRACKNAGIKDEVNTHMLRHTFITRSKEAGVDVEATKSTVGHDSTYVTMSIYNENQKDYLAKQGNLYVNYINSLNTI